MTLIISHLMKRQIFLCGLYSLLQTTGFAEMPPPKSRVIIAALGDSTTAGTPFAQSPLENPPNGSGDMEGQYSYWMMHWRPEWKVLNYGIAGQTTIQIRARFKDIINVGPRYVIILAGVNDIYQGLPNSVTAENLLWMYQEAQAHSIMPIAATLL